MDQETQDELRRILELNLDDLIREIGSDIARAKKHALPPSPTEAKRLTDNWWQDNVEVLRRAICGRESLKQISCHPTEIVQIAIEILDLISGLILSISPLKVCGLLVKRGLVSLCGDDWKKV